MTKTLNVAIAGLGIVGGGVYEILSKESNLLNKRSKKEIKLVAVASRSSKDFVDKSKVKIYQNALDLADDKEIDVIVETIGGDGIAYELCKKALNNGKHFVTANKAMLAKYGVELAKIAEKNNVALAFEASVAGSIPILKSLKEGLAANEIKKIYGIVNGTCNYILTKMEEDNLDFSIALKQAQDLGYAEADPTFDIENIDSAHKLTILSAIAKNCQPDFNSLYIEGITKISIDDIRFALEFGYKIKSLVSFENFGNKIRQFVYPALVKKTSKIANVNDSYNAILTLASNAEWNFQVGRGAGSKPTASAVVADIIDIANDRYNFAFGVRSEELKIVESIKIEDRVGEYYLRFLVDKDYAKNSDFIIKLFNNPSIIEQSIVKENDQGKLIYALKIGNIEEKSMKLALSDLENTSQITSINLIRIEDFS